LSQIFCGSNGAFQGAICWAGTYRSDVLVRHPIKPSFVAVKPFRNEGFKVIYNPRLQNKQVNASGENFGKVVAFAPLTSAEEP
jgi:hypothetical protein